MNTLIFRNTGIPAVFLLSVAGLLTLTGCEKPVSSDVAATVNGRSISYTANFRNVNRLMNYLMENCCGGRGCTIDVTQLSTKSENK